jgi:hypothetical protein
MGRDVLIVYYIELIGVSDDDRVRGFDAHWLKTILKAAYVSLMALDTGRR